VAMSRRVGGNVQGEFPLIRRVAGTLVRQPLLLGGSLPPRRFRLGLCTSLGLELAEPLGSAVLALGLRRDEIPELAWHSRHLRTGSRRVRSRRRRPTRARSRRGEAGERRDADGLRERLASAKESLSRSGRESASGPRLSPGVRRGSDGPRHPDPPLQGRCGKRLRR